MTPTIWGKINSVLSRLIPDPPIVNALESMAYLNNAMIDIEVEYCRQMANEYKLAGCEALSRYIEEEARTLKDQKMTLVVIRRKGTAVCVGNNRSRHPTRGNDERRKKTP